MGKDVKPEVDKQGFSAENISSDEHILHAAVEMDKGLLSFGIEEYDLDNLASVLLTVYDEQQKNIIESGKFSLLALISMALLELGIIVECEED